MLIPLAIINHFKPTRELAGLKNSTSFNSAPSTGLHPSARSAVFCGGEFFPTGGSRPSVESRSWSSADAEACARRSRALDVERSGRGSDGLAAVSPGDAESLISLRGARYSPRNPIYEKAAKDFAGLFVDDPEDFRIQPCNVAGLGIPRSNVIALAESGRSGGTPGPEESGGVGCQQRSSCVAIGRQQSTSRAERLGFRIQ